VVWDPPKKPVNVTRKKPYMFATLAAALVLVMIVPPSFSQPTDNFTFTAVGDWGCNSNTVSMTSTMNRKNPEVVLGLGDYSYSTSMGCWHDILNQYPTIHNNIHPAVGNHEDDNCPDCQSGTYLNAAGRAEFLSHFNITSTFYSFDHKRVHFIALDTENDTPAQYNFARDDLGAAGNNTDIDWIVAYMHHPMYTSCIEVCGHSGGNHTAFRDAYQPLFDQHVDLVLYGHYHLYERMKPMVYNSVIQSNDAADYVDPYGQLYVTVGTGGRDHDTYTSQAAMSVKQVPDFGFLQVDVSDVSLRGKFIDLTDTVKDSFVVVKTGEVPPYTPPPPPPPPPSSHTVTDNWALSLNTADYTNNYQVKLGEKVADSARQGAVLYNTTIYMKSSSGVTGSLRADLINLNTNQLVATSTNSISRSSMSSTFYLPYTFSFPAGTLTPNANFFVGIECIGCNSGQVFIAEQKTTDPYPLGNAAMFRSNAWVMLPKDVQGSATYEVAN